jgi:hypothetical protein
MKTLLSGAVILAAFAAPAAAETRYDVKLEKAVMEIVARKIGDIRGGFSVGKSTEFVQPSDATQGTMATDPVETGSVKLAEVYSDRMIATRDDPIDAAERKISRIIAF